MQYDPFKTKVKIIKSFFCDITEGKEYNVLNKKGLCIVTDYMEFEYDLKGSYNEDNCAVEYEILT